MLGALAYMLQPMFDDVFLAGNMNQVWMVGGIIMGLFVVRAVTSVGHKVLLTTISRKSIADLQNDMMAHLMTLDMSFFQKHSPGYLIERVQGDVQALNQIWSAIVRGAGRDFVSLVALISVTVLIDPIWTLVGVAAIPLLVLPSLVAQRYTGKQAGRAREVAAKMATRLDETFHGISAIKLNVLQKYTQSRYRDLTDHQVQVEVKTQFGSALIPAFVDIMSGLGFVGIIIYGGYEIASSEKSVGEFMAFFTALGLAFEPLRRLGAITGLLKAASVSVERMREILNAVAKLKIPAEPIALPSQGDIQFSNVSVTYGDKQVLKNVSFTALHGKRTALVGASGAGKTTLFHTFTRLVDYTGGDVTIGGTSIKNIDPSIIRDNTAVVAQDAMLFDETIRENIVFGQEVSDEALNDVLEASYMAEFISDLPGGLDFIVGPRGSSVSGGQRQRIAIARALWRNTPILLLDEATSALDTKSEAAVQKALDGLAEGRTTLVIAHRLSTIQSADQIIVLDQGQVVETGTHAELLKKGGHYAMLCNLQFQDTDA